MTKRLARTGAGRSASSYRGLALRKSYVSRKHSPNPPVVRVIPSWPPGALDTRQEAHEPQPEITVVVLEIVVSRSSRISPVRDRSNGPLWLLPLLDMLRPSDVVAAAFAMPRRFGGSPSGVDRVASAALCLSL